MMRIMSPRGGAAFSISCAESTVTSTRRIMVTPALLFEHQRRQPQCQSRNDYDQAHDDEVADHDGYGGPDDLAHGRTFCCALHTVERDSKWRRDLRKFHVD